MSTAPHLHAEEHSQADEFSALEERVMRLVELLQTERRERSRAEENAGTLQQLLDEQSTQLAQAEEELRTLGRDRDQIRGRVERLLHQLDEAGS